MPRLTRDTAARLVSGRGEFVGDLAAEGRVEVCFVRSALPHARIDRVDLRTPRGVTGAELGLRPIPLEAGGMVPVDWQPLALDRVRYVGEPVALVWAGDRYTAEDLAEGVVVDCSPLPAGTPVHDAAPDDLLLSRVVASGGGLDDAMAAAALVVERTFHPARQSAVPLETRGVLAEHDAATGVTTVWTSTQLPHLVRRGIAHALGADEASVRVLVPNVGGGFGLKANLYAEEIALAALARRLGVPVRWIEDRTENLLAGTHAHDTQVTVRVAADGSGRLLAVDAAVRADVGAYSVWPTTAMPEAAVAAMSLFAPYVFPTFRVRIEAVATNKAPVGPCRGIGQNAAVFATERAMDLVAAGLGIDPVEVRRRNVVRDLGWTSPTGRKLDSGDYDALLSLVEPDYRRLRAVQAETRAAGRLFGVGIGVFNEISASGSQAYRARGVTTLPGTDAARAVVTDDGRIEVYTSAADAGQGHADAYRTLAAAELGLDPDRIDVIEGDTTRCPAGSGTFISRGAVGVAASVLEALRGVAKNDCAPGTDVTAVHDPTEVYPCGVHLAAVEIDPADLVPRVVSYLAAEDCGRIIDPGVVEGQIRGGVAMGIGEVLYEGHRYSPDGQLETATLRDYLLPLAPTVPDIEVRHHESPTPATPLGTKGVGESGTIGAFGAVPNAVADALTELGVELTELPLTPERVFAAMAAAAGTPPPGPGAG
ncbi:MAG TPA: xanthine dehydrogenase family protein molybdopterin-binding subunit [Geodermatophilus sp.]|nr:xanthine dehydrogenase family protein molybdopterin-binding subunit [Geodermatophilus sp.]